MYKRTALHVALCAWLFAMTHWPDRAMAQVADAAESPTSTANEPPVTTPPQEQDEHNPAGRESENAAAGIRPPAERQTESERPRLRGLGKQHYPREEPDVGFGGPSRTHDADGDAAR